ncbi:MAG: hypothetical protein GX304_02245 [Clostridiales bacterium]|nr:hypothetical protein [Clostridiales bacterium]
MKRVCRFFAFVMLIFAISASSGCESFKAPPSMMVEANIFVPIFSTNYPDSPNIFNKYGFEAAQLTINFDGSGHIYFFIRNSTVEERKNSIYTAIEEINEKAYTEGDFQAGYRLVWVQEKNITQEGNDVGIIVEFKNANFFNNKIGRSSDVKLQSLEEYLAENAGDVEGNNNFTDASTRKKTSIVSIEDKEGYKVVTLSKLPNHIPVKFAGSLIYAYYLNDYNGNEVVEINRDTIKSSLPNYKVLIKPSQTSKALMIIAILFGVSFAVSLTVKLILDINRRKRRTIDIYTHSKKSN